MSSVRRSGNAQPFAKTVEPPEQFEREVTAERIRDKIAASKRKGLWVGDMVPLGYSLSDGKLSIDPNEAKTVRLIFERYLELGSVNRLVADLKSKGLTSKVRKLSAGAVRAAFPSPRDRYSTCCATGSISAR